MNEFCNSINREKKNSHELHSETWVIIINNDCGIIK